MRPLTREDNVFSRNGEFQEVSERNGIMQSRVSRGTAASPDDIRMKLIALQSLKGKQKLREGFFKITTKV